MKESGEELESFEFRGNAREYFRIWIVNVFLSIVTLGIYSAWAKVRTNRYIYANTFYKDASFEYTANPVSILKGRVIVVLVYLSFILSSEVFLNPIISSVLLILALLVTPWIINKAVKFKLKNTKYRNIRFRYTENAPAFYLFFVIHALLNIVTLGLAYPYSIHRFKALIINNSRYGNGRFNYEGKASGMYSKYVQIILFSILFMVAFGAVFGIFSFVLKSMPKEYLVFVITVGVYILYIVYFILFKTLYVVFVTNYVWSHTELEYYRFRSDVKLFRLFWIYVTNFFMILFSLGLLYPYARIRALKYRLAHFYLGIDNVDRFCSEMVEDESALAEEAEDFFDMDIGI